MAEKENYAPKKIHPSGRKENPYDVTLSGVIYANGDQYVSTSEAEQPAPLSAPAISTPGCRNC